MVTRSFGAEMWRLTASEMTFSAGAAAGGVLIAAWGGFRNRMHTTALACALYGLLMIGLGIAPIFIMYLVFNFYWYNDAVLQYTSYCVIAGKVEPSMHGRMFSLVQIANSCALPLGMIIFGPLSDMFSVEILLIYAGIFVLFCAMYIVLSKRFEV